MIQKVAVKPVFLSYRLFYLECNIKREKWTLWRNDITTMFHNNKKMYSRRSQFLMIFSLVWSSQYCCCHISLTSQISAVRRDVNQCETRLHATHGETQTPAFWNILFAFRAVPLSPCLPGSDWDPARHRKTRGGVVMFLAVWSVRMFGYWNKWYFSCREQF